MMTDLDRLLSSASCPLSECEPTISKELCGLAGPLIDDYVGMLRQRNGYYALEGALHVFPSSSSSKEVGLDEWNESTSWRAAYGELTADCLFFAEDVFGGQFCIKNGRIYTFDPETGLLDYLADDMEGWARVIVSDFDFFTGYSLARQWQKKNGQIPTNKRLLPKIPFVAGGGFKLSNLGLVDAVEGMRFRAEIAKQIKDLPDGSRIDFSITD